MKYRFRTKPFPSQKKGLVRLWKRGGGALYWDPGTGKTKTALDYASALHKAGECRRVLILCPINALQVWPDQAEKHIPVDIWWEMEIPEGTIADKTEQIREWSEYWENNDEPLLFVAINYDAISRRDKRWEIMAALERFYSPDLLICDESQKVKTATAKRSKAAHKLGLSTKRTVLMSGTPVSKNYLDLYSQLKVVDQQIWQHPEEPKIMSWTEFKNRYGIWGGRTGYELRGYQNLQELQSRYKPWITTARRSGNLPKVTDLVVPVDMSAQAREAYDIFMEESLVVWKHHLIEAPIPLTRLLRGQQMTGGRVLDEHGESVEFQMDKMSIACDLISDLREAERKLLVFARFKWEMDYIADKFKREVLSIRGGVSNARRKEATDAFRKGKKTNILVIQIGSSEALDGLQDVCSDAVFYSTDYSWEHYSQARGRIDRTGQSVPVVFHHVHVRSSVDKLVWQSLRDKRNLERMVMDDPDVLLVDR
jgi:SNF2 family DNA or RNA helicase